MLDPICGERRLTVLVVPLIVAVFSVGCGSEEAARPSAVERLAGEAEVEPVRGGQAVTLSDHGVFGHMGDTVHLVGIEWRLVSITSVDGEVVTPLRGAVPTLTFMTATTPTTGSYFRGFSGCNLFGGRYQAGDGGTLSVASGSAMTRMACSDAIMHRANLLMAALEAATTYRILGDRLSISFGGGTLHFDAGA